MTHIELSLSPSAHPSPEATVTDPLEQWAASVTAAEESCLVIDASGVILAASGPCARMLRQKQPLEFMGRHLLDREVLALIDFTAAGNELAETEREQIPPLLALSSGRLARSLLRVRNSAGIHTLDAIATPLRRNDSVVGSLTFFAAV
ncbi:MAG TPA: hypothetical protein VF062_14215 [Candidatus Limnocylindrales bacterium]